MTANCQFRMETCRLPGVDAVVADTTHAFPRHTHDQFGIGLITSGAQVSASGRGRVEAKKGDGISVNPGEVHDGAPIGDAGRSWRMLYLDPGILADLANDYSEGADRHYEFRAPTYADPRFGASFRTVFAAITDPLSVETLDLETGLAELLAALGVRRPRHDIDHPRAVRLARQRLDDMPERPHSLEDLAAESETSRFQLIRAFRKAMGMTPHAYLVQKRVELARRLIASGLPLAEAAASSGFADQSHMTRDFVRRHGITPGAYARARA